MASELPISAHTKVRAIMSNARTRTRVMFQKMLEKAEGADDPSYSLLMKGWLNGKFSTIVLRDELCFPFKWMFFNAQKPSYQDLDWFNAFADLDSAHCKMDAK